MQLMPSAKNHVSGGKKKNIRTASRGKKSATNAKRGKTNKRAAMTAGKTCNQCEVREIYINLVTWAFG